MSVTLRVVQNYDIRHEKEFLELERSFAELERRRSDYVEGKRSKPISGAESTNTLIWEGEFPSLKAADDWLAFLAGDAEHDQLFARQQPFFKSVRIEFYENLDY